MATRPRKTATQGPDDNITDYRYPAKRKNNPPAGVAGQGRIAEVPKQRYSYDARLPLILRFDATGKEDVGLEVSEPTRRLFGGCYDNR